MSFVLFIGLAGMSLVLLAFGMVQTHRWSRDDWVYDACNALGSLLLVLNAWAEGAWPFLVLNLVWGALSLRDLVLKDRWPGVRISKARVRRESRSRTSR